MHDLTEQKLDEIQLKKTAFLASSLAIGECEKIRLILSAKQSTNVVFAD